ncbi:hypothetical protein BKA70DRAFT_1441171 [Coprinopsis sp. MPI-PUGE-AT-0042]|nr:hypothetical protein BKA70DRAFT_1441171 [Coprinopsis sp. MPI-PUGE-AT-0042]
MALQRGKMPMAPSIPSILDHCGRFERLWADTHDYVTVEAFNDIVKVFNLRDDDPEVPFIPRGKFFSRYTIKPKLYRITPKVGENSCICNEPYSPDDDSEQGLMHFCPRPQCRNGIISPV